MVASGHDASTSCGTLVVDVSIKTWASGGWNGGIAYYSGFMTAVVGDLDFGGGNDVEGGVGGRQG